MATPNTEILSPVEQAVAKLPQSLRKAKIKRSCFTTTELWVLLFDVPPTRGSIVELGYALGRAGYSKFGGGNGTVLKVSTEHGSSRYWIIQRTEEPWTPRKVRADVKANPL